MFTIEEEKEETQSESKCTLRQILPRVLLICLIMTFFILLFVYKEVTEELIMSFVDFVDENNALGVVTTIAICATISSLGAPNAISTFGVGFIYGIVFEDKIWLAVLLGAFAVCTGKWIGSLVSFVIGRYVFRSCSERLI